MVVVVQEEEGEGRGIGRGGRGGRRGNAGQMGCLEGMETGLTTTSSSRVVEVVLLMAVLVVGGRRIGMAVAGSLINGCLCNSSNSSSKGPVGGTVPGMLVVLVSVP
jgi:hypothetical protein